MKTISIAITLVLACHLFSSVCVAQVARTNTLESLRAAYDSASTRIITDIKHQKDEALIQYGKTLEAIIVSLKQKGDIDTYEVVAKELKRFQSDKTILTNSQDASIANAVVLYQKQVVAADAEANRRTTSLLKKYIVALSGLVKNLMFQDKIDEAKAVGDVKRSAESMLAEIASLKAGVSPARLTDSSDPDRVSAPLLDATVPVAPPISLATPEAVDPWKQKTGGTSPKHSAPPQTNDVPVLRMIGMKASPGTVSVNILTKTHFDRAIKTGHGNWSLDRKVISVYSWSYGFPGLLIFGNETDSGSLQATMKNSGYAAGGFQGLVLCLTKEEKQDDGYHGSPAYFVRYMDGVTELLDAIPYHKAQKRLSRLASAPVEIRGDAQYTLRMSIQDGDKVTVWVNEKKTLEYSSEKKITGRYALIAANGSYTFANVKGDAINVPLQATPPRQITAPTSTPTAVYIDPWKQKAK